MQKKFAQICSCFFQITYEQQVLMLRLYHFKQSRWLHAELPITEYQSQTNLIILSVSHSWMFAKECFCSVGAATPWSCLYFHQTYFQCLSTDYLWATLCWAVNNSRSMISFWRATRGEHLGHLPPRNFQNIA